MERKFDKVRPYKIEVIDRKLRRNEERNAEAEGDWPYLLVDGTTIKSNELTKAPVVTVGRSSIASYASGLVERFKKIIKQISLALGQEVPVECG